MQRRMSVMLAAVALMATTAMTAETAGAATGPAPAPNGAIPTSANTQSVVDALVASGSTLAQAQADAQVPAIRDWVAVREVDEMIDTDPSTPPAPVSGPTTPNTAASSTWGRYCTGTARSGAVRRSFYTWWGKTLGYAQDNHTWCFSGGKITFVSHYGSHMITTDAGIAGWSWNGWGEGEEYPYTYNGHVYGGYKILRTGQFKFCTPIRVVCTGGADVRPRVYLHYDGSRS